MMKKFVNAMILVLTLALAVSLTGCGKSEEEKAWEEIRGHLEQEAGGEIPQDTFDWSAYAQAQQREAAQQAQDDQAQWEQVQQQLDALLPELTAALEGYHTAASGAEITRYGQEFNALYSRILSLTEDPYRQPVLEREMGKACGRRNPLADYMIAIKAALADSGFAGSYDSAHCYYNVDRNEARVALISRDPGTGLLDTIRIVKADGSVSILDVKSLCTDRTTHAAVIGMNGDLFLIYIVDNADYVNYSFDVTQPCPQSQVTQEGGKDWFWFDFSGTMEDFSAREPVMY